MNEKQHALFVFLCLTYFTESNVLQLQLCWQDLIIFVWVIFHCKYISHIFFLVYHFYLWLFFEDARAVISIAVPKWGSQGNNCCLSFRGKKAVSLLVQSLILTTTALWSWDCPSLYQALGEQHSTTAKIASSYAPKIFRTSPNVFYAHCLIQPSSSSWDVIAF